MRALLVATVLPLLLLTTLTACGDDATPQVLSDTEHSAQDVAFAGEMLQHHAQALAMVDLTLERRLEADVAALAEQIRDAQAPEIELMTDWLVAWDEPVPATVRDHSLAGHGDHSPSEAMAELEGRDGHEGHDTGSMPGMLTSAQLASLEEASDQEFTALWLELMIAHHEGAVEMAQAQQATGTFRPAVELAEEIERSQTVEIETMRGLLG
ncbi:MAG: DUF305 domain-containing protein [Actinobacteria bacterium]|uniref:Uncharacterized protein (DUF305 family) n=1 Tax=Nocardioides marinus TaxID=374514 RepID=A0A7Y9YH34_9ACTN|nr:DUF305 domain-containing protein [Actinomycetota bacterium]MBU2110016.1 DUF305 domain-containing protein [Actinomycetota bacterium]NYI12126.1 uncharacterized protein (DUF305 family) [Nocardioides marinus]